MTVMKSSIRYATKLLAGKRISAIGIGTIPLLSGNVQTLPYYHSPSVREAVRILQKAVANGITWFDTAVMPEYGDAEVKLGEALRESPELLISSKARAYSQDAMRIALDHSCSNLKRDRIEIYGLHQVAPENVDLALDPEKGALKTLLEAKATGKIMGIGLGTHHVSVARRALLLRCFDLIQIPYNLLENGMAQTLKSDTASDCLLVANKVLACGLLLSYACLADLIGYALQPPFDAILVGIGTEHELDALIDSHANGFSKERALKAQSVLWNVAHCNRCQECCCPRGIDISKILRYRSYMLLGKQRWVRERYSVADASAIQTCDHCGKCLSACPMKTPIPDLLHEFSDLMLTTHAG